MILFCSTVYVHNICEDKFANCIKSFSWLGQKVNKNRSTHCAHAWLCPGETSRHCSILKKLKDI